jgi:hypothetical protein
MLCSGTFSSRAGQVQVRDTRGTELIDPNRGPSFTALGLSHHPIMRVKRCSVESFAVALVDGAMVAGAGSTPCNKFPANMVILLESNGYGVRG